MGAEGKTERNPTVPTASRSLMLFELLQMKAQRNPLLTSPCSKRHRREPNRSYGLLFGLLPMKAKRNLLLPSAGGFGHLHMGFRNGTGWSASLRVLQSAAKLWVMAIETLPATSVQNVVFFFWGGGGRSHLIWFGGGLAQKLHWRRSPKFWPMRGDDVCQRWHAGHF